MNFYFICIQLLMEYLFDSFAENVGNFMIKKDTKFPSLSNPTYITTSKLECALQCQKTKCCAASYNGATNACYFNVTHCYFDVEASPGWEVLHTILSKVFVNELKTWPDAEAHCISFGGHLAKVLKPADDELLKSLIPEGVNYVWIDGSDEGKEGNWTWNNPMENILLDYWGPNRPDNAGSGQDCMIYRYFSGEYLWDDRECTDNDYPFICDI
ncbi:C-type Lectin CRL-like [Mytilus edulis]|uniref:C-type Lectin CRL-like n=1 Tax=Mytilus edulis TaxID=6550 RepID=UPI0039F0F594